MVALSTKILFIYYKFGDRLSERSAILMTDELKKAHSSVDVHDEERHREERRLKAYRELADAQLRGILESMMTLKVVRPDSTIIRTSFNDDVSEFIDAANSEDQISHQYSIQSTTSPLMNDSNAQMQAVFYD